MALKAANLAKHLCIKCFLCPLELRTLAGLGPFGEFKVQAQCYLHTSYILRNGESTSLPHVLIVNVTFPLRYLEWANGTTSHRISIVAVSCARENLNSDQSAVEFLA